MSLLMKRFTTPSLKRNHRSPKMKSQPRLRNSRLGEGPIRLQGHRMTQDCGFSTPISQPTGVCSRVHNPSNKDIGNEASDKFWRSGIWTLKHHMPSGEQKSHFFDMDSQSGVNNAPVIRDVLKSAKNNLQDSKTLKLCEDENGAMDCLSNSVDNKRSVDAQSEIRCSLSNLLNKTSFDLEHKDGDRILTSNTLEINNPPSITSNLSKIIPPNLIYDSDKNVTTDSKVFNHSELAEHTFLVETLSISPASKKRRNGVSDNSQLSYFNSYNYETLKNDPSAKISDHSMENLSNKKQENSRNSVHNCHHSTMWKGRTTLQQFLCRTFLKCRRLENYRRKMSSSTSDPSGNKSRMTVPPKETYYRPVKMARSRNRHLDAFEFYRAEDEREWARRFEELHVDTKSASSMFKLLQSKLQYSAAYPHFLSLLHHLLLLMPGDLSSPDRWLLFDRILQQLVTQETDGSDREVTVVDINVKEIVQLLASERELVENRQKIARLEGDNADAITELNNREQKIYQITQEKEALDRAHQQMANQLDVEVKRGEEMDAQRSMLEIQVTRLGHQLQQLAEGKNLPAGVTQNIRKSILSTSAVLSNGHKSPSSTPPPPPPPPPPNSSAPLPPPPPLVNGIGLPPPPPPQAFRPAKKVPKSTTQLRALNWSKLPESKLSQTVFATLDESPLYKALDLEDIDRTFDASSSKKGMEGEKTMERKRTMRTTNATVLESRRQQNCAILLSKLKLSNEELIRVLLNMDVDYVLAPDMVEQLLKFTPTPEEKSMLEEHAEEISSFSRADKFLYEISKLDHYGERLRCLLYQKKFKERVAETEPKVTAVTAAAQEVVCSKRLKRFLELVLAFGNYMNKGPRGGAFGFKMSSLNKLAEVKATSDRNVTLLHYIVKVCSQQWPDMLLLFKDLPSVHQAAKVSLTELQKEISSLSEGLSYIEKEVTWHRGQGSAAPKGDRFRIAMTEFLGVAMEKHSSLEAQFKEMNSQLERVAILFGEDPKTVQPDELFGTFDNFLEGFKEAQKDLENSRKREEEEERKKKEVEDRERRAKERKLRITSNTNGQMTNGMGKNQNGGSTENGTWEKENDFDDLISALRSGDVFGKDIDKMRRKKKYAVEQTHDRERGFALHKYA